MELKELSEKTLVIFEVDNVELLKDKLLDVVINDRTDYYDNFVNLIDDLSIDWIQMIYQYYLADREDKKQDYTPKSLAKLLSKLTNDSNEILDLCAGSGALTIQSWCENRNASFICQELDENVIPFLLFNLAIRNIDAVVEQKDILEDEIIKKYKVTKRDKYSKVEVVNELY